MASATATANREAGESRLRWWPGSRLGRLILVLNLLGLAVLIIGSLVLNELRQGLIRARIEGLAAQGRVIANVIDDQATSGDPEPALDAIKAGDFLLEVFIGRTQRARLFDAEGNVIADSLIVADRVDTSPLPPARPRGMPELRLPFRAGPSPDIAARARQELSQELGQAHNVDDFIASNRISETGRRVVSVSIPIRRVRAVLGVLTLEATDVDQIIADQRRALAPFILIAVTVTLVSSLLLTWLIAQPIFRLARAADRVRLSRARAIELPDLAHRDDEIGDLTRSLGDMTHALTERMDAIESFAADVAHEIRNPLTSIRSAVETLDIVRDDAPRARLLGILKQDVGRLDRLVTDISNASRLDAELGREDPKPIDLAHLMTDVVSIYDGAHREGEPTVRLSGAEAPLMVSGREGPLSQVFRNLIDNARSFSPPGGEVRLSFTRIRGQIIGAVEDDGPGMPPENLETVFERFYTSRPKGAAFGGNSGLGLSIARQIVEAHGGTIRAENRTGQGGEVIGARFVVMLPEVRA